MLDDGRRGNPSRLKLTRDIEGLQAPRRAAGLPPLWIAADQEGGLVATLSPPLPRPAPLATVALDVTALQSDARDLARQLAVLGVNVNFAPLVDVSRGRLDPADRNSRIALRNLSNDPAVMARDAEADCRSLATEGVRCTIKHFPGLGDVTADTHVTIAHRAAINPVDLAPFRQLTAADGPHPWVMLSHLIVDRVDSRRPEPARSDRCGILNGLMPLAARAAKCYWLLDKLMGGQGSSMPRVNRSEADQQLVDAHGAEFLEVLARGLRTLMTFNAEHRSLTLSELSQATDLSRATVRRIFYTLESLGFVHAEGRQFKLTPKCPSANNLNV